MEIEVKENGNSVALYVSGDMIINQVKKAHEQVSDIWGRFSTIIFDLSQVHRIDTSGFQLLLFFRREAGAKNQKVIIEKPSDDVVEIFQLYGEELETG